MMSGKLLILLIVLMSASPALGGDWYAMSRHGECIDLAVLNAKDEHVKGTSTPEEMERELKKAGIQYTIEPLIEKQESMLKLSVPSKNWAMILVAKSHCKRFLRK